MVRDSERCEDKSEVCGCHGCHVVNEDSESMRLGSYNEGVVKRRKYLSGTVSSSSNARH